MSIEGTQKQLWHGIFRPRCCCRCNCDVQLREEEVIGCKLASSRQSLSLCLYLLLFSLWLYPSRSFYPFPLAHSLTHSLTQTLTHTLSLALSLSFFLSLFLSLSLSLSLFLSLSLSLSFSLCLSLLLSRFLFCLTLLLSLCLSLLSHSPLSLSLSLSFLSLSHSPSLASHGSVERASCINLWWAIRSLREVFRSRSRWMPPLAL